MPEAEDPFADFDLQAFFRSVKKNGMKAALAEQQPTLPSPKNPESQFDHNLRNFQVRVLFDYFFGMKLTTVPEMAQQFKSTYDKKKEEVLKKSEDPTERRFYEETSMTSFSQVAVDLLIRHHQTSMVAYAEDPLSARMDQFTLKTIKEVTEFASTL